MRRSLGLVMGGIGAIGAALFLRGRRGGAVAGADPAAELRRRLATARSGAEPVASRPVLEPQPPSVESAPHLEPSPEPQPADLETRRGEVHARARAAVEEMRGGSTREDPAPGEAG